MDDLINYTDPILSVDSINKEFYLIDSKYKHDSNKFSFKLDETTIDPYNDPNDVQITINKQIYSRIFNHKKNFNSIYTTSKLIPPREGVPGPIRHTRHLSTIELF